MLRPMDDSRQKTLRQAPELERSLRDLCEQYQQSTGLILDRIEIERSSNNQHLINIVASLEPDPAF